MRIIKSIGLGLLAVLAALVVFVVAMIVVLLILSSHMAGDGGIGWDPVSFTRQMPGVWIVICVIFAVGFAFGYRRHSPRLPQ